MADLEKEFFDLVTMLKENLKKREQAGDISPLNYYDQIAIVDQMLSVNESNNDSSWCASGEAYEGGYGWNGSSC